MKIGIQTLLPTASFLNKRYSIEKDFPDDSNPAEAFQYLDEIVTAIHRKEFPQFYSNNQPLYLGEENLPEMQVDKPIPHTSLEDQIRSCKEIKVLESYRILIKNDPVLSKVYNEMMFKLA